MSGSLGGAVIEIDGDIVNSTPTWVVGGATASLVSARPGDLIVWKALNGTHGVVFNTTAEAAAVLDFRSGGGLPSLGPVNVKGENVWGTKPQPKGTTLAKATVKADPAGGTILGFFCSQHGRAMSGSVLVNGPPVGQETDLAYVFKSIKRNDPAMNRQPVPGTPINTTPRSFEIDGDFLNKAPTWLSDGKPASQVVIKPGDTVVWKADKGRHGVVFDTQAQAESVLDFQTGGSLPTLGPVEVNGEKVWGTKPQDAGTVLASATVKNGVKPGTTLGFFCSQHGRHMGGTLTAAYFTFPAYVVRPSTDIDKGGVEPTDPFTPLLRAYANDKVEVRVLVGAHTLAHSFQVQGVRWEYEPDYPNSGYKNAQAMGISEHFELIFQVPPVGADHKKDKLLSFADYLVSPSSSVDGLANGDWTILRAFTEQVGVKEKDQRPSPTYLAPLPNNLPDVKVASTKKAMSKLFEDVRGEFKKPAKDRDKHRKFRSLDVTATTALKAYGGPLSFNPRVHAPYDLNTAVLFVRTGDLDKDGKLKPGAPKEPLILRVAAGDWVEVNLTNALGDDPAAPGFPAPQDLSPGSPFVNGSADRSNRNVLLSTSRQVGLHPALVSYDATLANGVNVGFNPDSTVAPGKTPNTKSFTWYAGELMFEGEQIRERPLEFGAINLVPGDMMVQPQFGMVGALVVEPEGSEWVEDQGTYASATVKPPHRYGRPEPIPFRDFVLVGQNVVANGPWGAFNYRTETFDSRNVNPSASGSQLTATRSLTFTTGSTVAPLGPVIINKVGSPPFNGLGNQAETVWGTNPKAPVNATTRSCSPRRRSSRT